MEESRRHGGDALADRDTPVASSLDAKKPQNLIRAKASVTLAAKVIISDGRHVRKTSGIIDFLLLQEVSV